MKYLVICAKILHQCHRLLFRIKTLLPANQLYKCSQNQIITVIVVQPAIKVTVAQMALEALQAAVNVVLLHLNSVMALLPISPIETAVIVVRVVEVARVAIIAMIVIIAVAIAIAARVAVLVIVVIHHLTRIVMIRQSLSHLHPLQIRNDRQWLLKMVEVEIVVVTPE